jgi:gliding motility-associated-like protein
MKTKQIVFLLLFFSHLLLLGQDLSNGLLLHYNFSGNADDVSGNNMHGVVDGAVLTAGKDGSPNTAYSFDGLNDLINFPNDNFLKPSLPITFSATFMLSNVPPGSHIIVNTDFSLNTYFGAWLGTNADMKLHLSYGAGFPDRTSPSDRRTFSTTNSINVGQWYNVVAIIRGATDMEIWIDCVKQNGTYSGTGSNSDLLYNTSPSINGGLGMVDIAGSPPYYMKGAIDDFKYWNRSLSLEETAIACVLSSNFFTVDKEVVHPTCGESNGSIVLTPSVSGTYTYDWNPNVSTTNEAQNLPAGTYEITISDGVNTVIETITLVNNNTGCTFTVDKEVVHPTCGESNGSIVLTPSVFGTYTYDWNPNVSTTNQAENLSAGTYEVTVSDGEDISTEKVILLEESTENELVFPNIFTPNKDGVNDYFIIGDTCYKEKHIFIYNRWEMLLFESHDINFKWDGTFNGKDVPDGTYYYLVELITNQNKIINHKGYVQISR